MQTPATHQRLLRGAPEEPVAHQEGDRQPEERRQPDDREHIGPVRDGEVPMALEVQRAEQRDARAGEAQDGHRHELVVERADPQEPGDGGAEQDLGGALLLALDVHAGGLEDVARLVGALLGLPDEEGRQRDGNPEERQRQAPAPVVGGGGDVADEEDPDGLARRGRSCCARRRCAPGRGWGRRRPDRRCGRCRSTPGRSRRSGRGRRTAKRCATSAMIGTVTEKMSRVMAATFFRLPRSANTATGIPQAIWATAATKITAPRPASLRWNELLDLGAEDADAVDDGVGDHGRHREQDQRARSRPRAGSR